MLTFILVPSFLSLKTLHLKVIWGFTNEYFTSFSKRLPSDTIKMNFHNLENVFKGRTSPPKTLSPIPLASLFYTFTPCVLSHHHSVLVVFLFLVIFAHVCYIKPALLTLPLIIRQRGGYPCRKCSLSLTMYRCAHANGAAERKSHILFLFPRCDVWSQVGGITNLTSIYRVWHF